MSTNEAEPSEQYFTAVFRIRPGKEPDYLPSFKVTVHQDEVKFGVFRVTATQYAPGLPPGEYDAWLELAALGTTGEPKP